MTEPRKFATRMVSPHFLRVFDFMRLAQQVPGDFLTRPPAMPTEAMLRQRAELIFEEAMETINAMGVEIMLRIPDVVLAAAGTAERTVYVPLNRPAEQPHVLPHSFSNVFQPNFVEIVDGLADVSVVTIGSFVALNVDDTPILQEVDCNNLAKFGPGHSFSPSGKLIKPPGHPKPDFASILLTQGIDPALLKG